METTLAPIVVDARYLEKRFNMSRIYSNYGNADYSDIMVMAKSLGFSASAFQKYCVMLYLKHNIKNRKNSTSLSQLTADMMTALNSMKRNSAPFIVSSLFDPQVWSNLSSSDKHTLAIQLSNYIKNHPNEYRIYSIKRGEPNRYQKV